MDRDTVTAKIKAAQAQLNTAVEEIEAGHEEAGLDRAYQAWVELKGVLAALGWF